MKRVLLVTQVMLVRKDLLASRVKVVFQESADRLVFLEKMDNVDLLEVLDRWDQKDLQDPQDLEERLVHVVFEDAMVDKDLRDLKLVRQKYSNSAARF